VKNVVRKHATVTAWAFIGLIGSTGLLAVTFVAVVDFHFASVLWLVLTLYLLPFVILVGAPSYSLARAGKIPRAFAGLLAVSTFVLAAYSAFPMAVQCDTSIAGRAKLLRQLSPAEAATLQTPSTLTSSNWPCPTFFVYRSDAGYVSVSAVEDFIHGVKLFKEVAPK
jgi:hypothetical protein